MDRLLAGDDRRLETLRRQMTKVEVTAREFTGVGFFTRFALPAGTRRVQGWDRRVIDDLHGTIDGLDRGVGFALFITDGLLSFLEGFSHAEDWPHEARLTSTHYYRPAAHAGAKGSFGDERDLEYVLRSR